MLVESLGNNISPEYFKSSTNSQSPQTWSDSLKQFGLQLAYCNTDVRRLSYFIEELKSYDDLFLISFYSVDPPFDTDVNGKLCTAHIITMQHCSTVAMQYKITAALLHCSTAVPRALVLVRVIVTWDLLLPTAA